MNRISGEFQLIRMGGGASLVGGGPGVSHPSLTTNRRTKMIELLIAMYMNMQVARASIDQTCIECIDNFCSIECDNTSENCGRCIQRWCSFEC